MQTKRWWRVLSLNKIIMKKIILLSAFTLVMYSAQAQTKSSEQNTQPNEQRHEKRNGKPMATPHQKASKLVSKMDTQLKLSDEQKASMSSLAGNHFNEIEQARVKETKARQEMRTSRINFEDGIKKILTPEQFKLWEQKLNEHLKKESLSPNLPKE